MHKHLERQVQRATRDGVLDVPMLLASVGSYYQELDRERTLRDRSLGLMSEELLTLNQRIRAQGEARFRSVFEQAGDGLIVVDAQDRVGRCNAAAAAMLASTPKALHLQPIGRFLPGFDREGEREAYRMDGTTLPVEVRRTPLSADDGGGALYNLRDISERQAAERERAAFIERLARSNTELERFAYIASHDLQEPLRSIISFSGLLQRRLEPVLDADSRDYLRFVIDGSTRLREMVRGLLELSRLDGEPPQRRPVALAALMEEARLELSAALAASGATLTVGVLPVIEADAQQIKRVLINLIGNAIKFHGAAPPRVEISAAREDGHWQIAVRDHGIGIAPEHQAEVFQVFRRLHTLDEYPGTGMGLAICQRIVHAHGGRIAVEAPVDGGSRFQFTLPAD